ncbi:MAG: bifunctional [glutamate--ammonia ligase]-adenylyl-L-tyrosine phosphorylase/[glutamate--ammonia-ligase] adenylyltransferase, partial [Gammaproteobacteria bacterium]|nr:bifunctional [glutamate--ammonia ligase]-adenylyl-L-tyrosine phosphorylase/[glutamate--ammonia-ligase] adenylyltransferase [Gammaproteobacteria bacterium]
MSLPVEITKSIAALPVELRETVSHFFERLSDLREPPPAAAIPLLARVAACSEFAAKILLRDDGALVDRLNAAEGPVSGAELQKFVRDFTAPGHSTEAAKAALRRQRNYLLTRIFWRDIAGGADVTETLASLSMVADALIEAACKHAAAHMEARFGVVRGDDKSVVPLVVLGMGKLGGRELNFSSDIDIIFAYSEDGASDGAKELMAQQYFDRVSRLVVALLDEVTADGFVYRTDTRLRPFGDSGPPVVSFAALESYLLHHGRDWERYAYVKARLVGPQPPDPVRRELFDNLITPFVYRRYLDYGVFESLRDMHRLISAEVQKRELANNVKLGPGGIREIEFIVQTLQLVRGGSREELQTPSLQSVLPLLVNEKGLNRTDADTIASAYTFLRKLENCIQAIRDAQTHELPTDPADRNRLCLAMNFSSFDELTDTLNRHRNGVSRLFSEITFGHADEANDVSLRQKVVDFWISDAPASALQADLEESNVAGAENIAIQIAAFRDAPATKKMSAVASERLQTFIPRLLRLSAGCAHPTRAVTRCLAVIEQVLRRSAYLALLNENRLAAARLVRLCEKSAYIAGELARYPVLLDELLDP